MRAQAAILRRSENGGSARSKNSAVKSDQVRIRSDSVLDIKKMRLKQTSGVLQRNRYIVM